MMENPERDARLSTLEQQLSQHGASRESEASQTATDFIEQQLQLEADAREALPYSFDSCTYALGPLRQNLFACLTCNPPPARPDEPFTAAAVCYSCSIACHGEHTLVELFGKRNFVCDCGTTRFLSSNPCTLRGNPQTGRKGVHSDEPGPGNKYNHNFQNRFCGCGEVYDAHSEKGTMFQCLGLGSVETGGCGEDWWHAECLIGLPRDWNQSVKEEKGKVHESLETKNTFAGEDEKEDNEIPLPPGFPDEDDFETFICYKCLDSNPWLKRYAGTPGFLPPVYKTGGIRKAEEAEDGSKANPQQSAPNLEQHIPATTDSMKRKNHEAVKDGASCKRIKSQQGTEPAISTSADPKHNFTASKSEHTCKHGSLRPVPPAEPFSLFVKENFRDHLCHCPECFPFLVHHPQLREEEETYEPPLSEDGDSPDGGGSYGTKSLLDRGEAALSNIDRVRAIEGAMVYNHLVGNVKEFLKPYAESGTPVSAEDIKAFFEKLRGDDHGIKEAAAAAAGGGANDDHEDDSHNKDGRREQSGY